MLQQYLPFTVLKHIGWCCRQLPYIAVATVLTVYGIETKFQTQPLEKINCCNSTYRLRYWNYDIILEITFEFDRGCNSTYRLRYWNIRMRNLQNVLLWSCNSTYRLRYWNTQFTPSIGVSLKLQQYLPFTVLKPSYTV